MVCVCVRGAGLAAGGRRGWGRQAWAGRAARHRAAVSRVTGLGWGRQVLHRRSPAAAAGAATQPEVNLVTALVPSDTACLLSSPAGDERKRTRERQQDRKTTRALCAAAAVGKDTADLCLCGCAAGMAAGAPRTGQDEAHGGLDLAAGHGGLLIVACQVAGLHRDLVKDILWAAGRSRKQGWAVTERRMRQGTAAQAASASGMHRLLSALPTTAGRIFF